MGRTVRHARTLAVLVAVGVAAGGAGASRNQLRVGLVLETTAVGDLYEHGAYAGLQKAVRELGIQGKVTVRSPGQNFVSAFTYLARQKYDLIIGLGFFETDALDTVARRFPHQRFAIVDASLSDLKHRPGNVLGTHFKTEEGGYLAGYLASSLAARAGKHVLGSVGGFKIPTVDEFIAGYQAGAHAADPRVVALNGYANDFVQRAKCRRIALQQIAAGATAILQVADVCGLGALSAAKEKHVWGIGVDVDESYLGPQILTSVVKRLDVAVVAIIESLKNGSFRTGHDAVFDLHNDGVGLGRISAKVPQALLRRLEDVRKAIVAGRIRVPARLGAR